MRHRKEFWLTLMALCLLFYGRALWHVIEGETGALSVIIAAIIIGLHILEVPMALRLLRNRNPNPIKVSALTIVFGLLWLIPARRGIFTAH